MAITGVTARGSAVSNAAGTTLSVNPTANLTVGKMVFCCSLSDNNQITDGASSLHSVADSVGNIWFKVGEFTDTDGAANDGVSVSIWGTLVTTQIGTGNTITLTLGASKTDKIITLFECSIAANKRLALEQLGVGQGAIAASVASMTSREYLLIGCIGAEGEDNAKTPDADYVEQFDLISDTVGALDVNIAIHVQTRVATLTGDTVTSTAWTNTNPMALLAAMYEVDPITVAAGVGQPVVTGFTSTITVSNNITASPGLGQVDCTGFDPAISVTNNLTVSTNLGQIDATGFAAGLNFGISTGFGEAIITGLEPTISVSDNQVIVTSVGVLVIDGFNPVVGFFINPGFGEMQLDGFSPAITLSDNIIVSVGFGELMLEGQAPRNNIIINTGFGEASLNGFEPSVNLSDNTVIESGLGEMSINGFSPSITASDAQTINTETGNLIISGFSPTIVFAITPGAGEIDINGLAPFVALSFVTDKGELFIAGLEPSVDVSGNTLADPGFGELILSGFAPMIFEAEKFYPFECGENVVIFDKESSECSEEIISIENTCVESIIQKESEECSTAIINHEPNCNEITLNSLT